MTLLVKAYDDIKFCYLIIPYATQRYYLLFLGIIKKVLQRDILKKKTSNPEISTCVFNIPINQQNRPPALTDVNL